ncbi:uncharacterized protein F4812DRAFT_210449 [Daldinia caldariorum]|uniref:uncharacterized protein n=1 Tax=Daldinia caldariorum TaxID=326644 RepID=UPI00200791E1|nr:uncharacterized protein F4812DRAFT_210449 [Daldinia caldariorum]KAI1464392.1 hypothetical protein F4812DRAFT_210449 [Daldinia caldariorum]
MPPSHIYNSFTPGVPDNTPQRYLRSSSVDRYINGPAGRPRKSARTSTVVHLEPVEEGDDSSHDVDEYKDHQYLESSPCRNIQRRSTRTRNMTREADASKHSARHMPKHDQETPTTPKTPPILASTATPARKATGKLAVVIETAPKAEKKITEKKPSQGSRRSSRVAATVAASRITETSVST